MVPLFAASHFKLALISEDAGHMRLKIFQPTTERIRKGINSKNVYALQIELIMYCFLVLFLFLFIDRSAVLLTTSRRLDRLFRALLLHRKFSSFCESYNKIYLFMFNNPAICIVDLWIAVFSFHRPPWFIDLV